MSIAINQSDLNSEIVRKAADNMRKRYRYSYSIFDLAYNFLVPVKVFCCCKRSLRNLHSRYLLYKKAEDKFAQEFDAVEFARSQRKLKMMMCWLMDKSERFLTAYQKSNAISLSTESDSLSDDPAYTKIPKMLASSKTKQKHVVQVNRFFVSATCLSCIESCSLSQFRMNIWKKSTQARMSICCTECTRLKKTTVSSCIWVLTMLSNKI